MKKTSYNQIKKEKYEYYNRFFKILLNKTRFEIVACLRNGPKCVNELCKETGYEQSRVSHNLKTLESQGFVIHKRKDIHIIYSINKKVSEILDSLDGIISKYKN